MRRLAEGFIVVLLLVHAGTVARAAEHEFRYKRPDADSVSLMSEFNGWKAVPMTRGTDGVWKAKISLPPGTQAYKFLVNGTEWVLDPENSARKTIDGVENSAVESPDAATSPGAPTTSISPSSAPTATARAETATGLQLAGNTLQGGRNEFDLTVTDVSALATLRAAYRKPSSKAKVLLVLPPGFNPMTKSWPILVVNSTTDGNGSSIGSAKDNYLPDATDAGYIVLAVDGEFGRPEGEGDSVNFRWALVAAAVNAINKEWTTAKTWPLVNAGISGGGGYASYNAMQMIQKQMPTIGLLLAATGWHPTDFPDDFHRTPYAQLRNLPVFLSAGDNDGIATKPMTERVNADLARAGFLKVRFEHFNGGHELNREHLKTALEWFLAQASAKPAGAASPGSSAFDSFFKKKP